jgi:hypothetical protein
VVSTTPFNLATRVPTNAEISVLFDERIDPLTVTTSTFRLRDQSGGFATVPSTVNTSADGLTLSHVPDESLLPNRAYRVEALTGIRDIAGNQANQLIYSFTTGAASATATSSSTESSSIDTSGEAVTDTVPPEVVMVTPGDTATDIGKIGVEPKFSKISVRPRLFRSFSMISRAWFVHDSLHRRQVGDLDGGVFAT